MRSLHLVDPEILSALDLFPSLDLDDSRLMQLRDGMQAMVPSLASYQSQGVELEIAQTPASEDAPPVDIYLHKPVGSNGPLPLFLHIHGGGYVLGSPLQSVPANMRTALELGCVVASVDYRLAPEASGATAVEDCHRALMWLVENAERFGIDLSRIAIGGESAGGGIAAGLALLNRDKQGPRLCFQMLIYPMIDDRTGAGEDLHPYCGEFVWTAKANRFGWQSFLGDVDPATHNTGYVIPARAANVADLPPTFISVGALDLFLEENLEYAKNLARAGVPVELHVYPGAYHGFELAADSSVAVRAETDRRAALGRAFALQPASP
jgi:triacylglycerol lipase